MSNHQKQYILSKITDIWYIIDRTNDNEKIQRYLGKLDGIYIMVEMLGYRIVRSHKTGERIIITEAQYQKNYA